jgi:DNA-binding PadR family transcriptional regulator
MENEKNKTERAGGRAGTATQDALLGVLSLAPMSGYTIRAVVEQSIGNFWSESFGQIYPALKRLTAEGMVQKKTERQKGRPDRNVYSLTEKGRDRLQEWLAIPAVPSVPRNDLLLKLFFGVHVPVSVSRENVQALVREHEAALKRYDGIRKEIAREHPGDSQAPFWLMTVSYGRHYSDAMLKWGKETLKELDAIETATRSKTERGKGSRKLKR